MQGFLIATYDSFERVLDSLKHVGVSGNNVSKDRKFLPLDAPKGCQKDTFDAYKFAQSLLVHTAKDRKSAVFIMSDLRSFLLTERTSYLYWNMSRRFQKR